MRLVFVLRMKKLKEGESRERLIVGNDGVLRLATEMQGKVQGDFGEWIPYRTSWRPTNPEDGKIRSLRLRGMLRESTKRN